MSRDRLEFVNFLVSLLGFLIMLLLAKWTFRIDKIVILLHKILKSLEDNSKQDSVLIQQNDEIIRLLDKQSDLHT